MIHPVLYESWQHDFEKIVAKRPIARPQYISWKTRVDDATLRKAWTVYMWEEQERAHGQLMPPCQWCGLPTGNYCDNDCSSEWVRGWFAAVCTDCEGIFGGCRSCSQGAIMRRHRDRAQQLYENSRSEEEEITRAQATSSQEVTSAWPSFTMW